MLHFLRPSTYELESKLFIASGQIHPKKSASWHVEGVKECLKLFIKKLSGETVSLDVKKMKGIRQDSIRIRKGDIRIIFSINEKEKIIHVNVIDFRGDVYK